MHADMSEEAKVEGNLEEVSPQENMDQGPEGQPEEEPQARGEQKMVPLAALHEERSRRQALQKEKEYLNTRLELLEGMLKPHLSAGVNPTVEAPSGKGGEALDTASAGQARELMKGLYHYQVFPEILALREEIARLKYPDYDEVVGGFTKELSGDAVLQQGVLSAPDPAEAAYKLAKQSAGREAQREKGTLQRIEKNLNAPKTPSTRGGAISPEGITTERLLEMSHEEFTRAWDSMTPDQRRRLCQG